MAKTLRTSGDYTIKAGAGTGGTHEVIIDAKTFRVKGDLTVDGDQTVVNTSMISVEDTFIELLRNNSGTTLDGGIYINRGLLGSDSALAENAVFYWDESEDSFKAALTSDNAGTSPITSSTLARMQVGEPVGGSDASTKSYVDIAISAAGTMSSFDVSDGVSADTIIDAETINIIGGPNIQTLLDSGSNTITIDLKQNLSSINSVGTGSSNADLLLVANGTGSVSINNILTFSSNATTPTATAITKLYSKAPGYGDTGVFFINSAVKSGTEQELISKRKATVLAIALG
jgi:hypothetical protein